MFEYTNVNNNILIKNAVGIILNLHAKLISSIDREDIMKHFILTLHAKINFYQRI